MEVSVAPDELLAVELALVDQVLEFVKLKVVDVSFALVAPDG